MNKIKKHLLALSSLLLMFITLNVYADSGLDAKYDNSSSPVDLISGLTSGASFIIQMIMSKPGDEDYLVYYAIAITICIILFYIFTNIYLFRINDKEKKAIIILGISLIPTLLFSLFCLLIKLIIFIYVLLLVIYIIFFMLYTKNYLKKRLDTRIKDIKEKDKSFDIDTINEKLFDNYKEIQLEWMNNKLDIVKDLLSEKIYKDYQEKLDKLTKENKKNIMDQIELVSDEITYVNTKDKIITIKCKMVVNCYDYIIDKEENVIKGKKDKKRNYTYELVFEKKINTNKYVLVEKKLLKEKNV